MKVLHSSSCRQNLVLVDLLQCLNHILGPLAYKSLDRFLTVANTSSYVRYSTGFREHFFFLTKQFLSLSELWLSIINHYWNVCLWLFTTTAPWTCSLIRYYYLSNLRSYSRLISSRLSANRHLRRLSSSGVLYQVVIKKLFLILILYFCVF